ncbi:hypothetical protein G6F57_014956 [Rhizopus arrhizus]|nr:hypothetical protein G6F31_016984 [Rhizopus arrhizus]KAG1305694.1 hypothetical protein G6F62_015536 [Rhizopus arrhizus]KAG1457121.1 hypothetical protein G6F57_014956 [Rhizopus arrhizus]
MRGAETIAQFALVVDDVIDQARSEARPARLVDQVGVHVDPVDIPLQFLGDTQGRVLGGAGDDGAYCGHGSSPCDRPANRRADGEE